MIITPSIRAMADEFFANTVENNEVMLVKWTFPNGEFPDLTLERAKQDFELAEQTHAQVEELLAQGGLSHEDEMILKILGHYCGYIQKNYLNWWQRFDLNNIYRVIPTLFDKMVSLPIETEEERALYLKVLNGFAPFVEFLEGKLEAQCWGARCARTVRPRRFWRAGRTRRSRLRRSRRPRACRRPPSCRAAARDLTSAAPRQSP